MAPAEFVTRIVGTPWVRWRSDFDGADCFGLLILWHRHVLGIELGEVPKTDIADGFSKANGWEQLPNPEAGATAWMAWRDGAPTHCGVMLDARTVLHSEGSADRPGSVRVSRLDAVARVYGPITFYRYTAC